ncbi:MAG: hypothetical protein ABSG46_18495 [Candidatus Binataceae bacterium]
MEVQEVILARAIRLVKVSAVVSYWPDIVEKLGTEYSFARLPDVREILSSQNRGAAKGAEFRVGKFMRSDKTEALIDRFTLFNDGLVADCRTSTDDCDLFLDSIAVWAKEHLSGIKNIGKSLYLSQMEVKFGVHKYAQGFDRLGQQVSGLIEKYGAIPGIGRFGFSSLAVSVEPGGLPNTQPSPFTIERRSNTRFDEDVFFAQAPLRTSDHRDLLAGLEQLLASI